MSAKSNYESNKQQNKSSVSAAQKFLNSISADGSQKKVIGSDEGPVYVAAGPGAGKTRSMVYRVVYLILKNREDNKDFGPENIMMLTFTRKAALEFKTRLALELGNQGINLNLSDMYLGTFDSQCFDLWGEYKHLLDDKMVSKWTKLLNDAKSKDYKIESFKNEIKDQFGKDADERLLKSKDQQGKDKYADQYTVIEYIVATELLTHKKVIDDLKKKIKYVIVDEAQDNNAFQWEIIHQLFRVTENICVVGDVNQSIYAFRDAQPEQFVNFAANNAEEGKPDRKELELKCNYRSDRRIVEFCNNYLEKGAPLTEKDNPVTKMAAAKKTDDDKVVYSDNAVAYLTIYNAWDKESTPDDPAEYQYAGVKALADRIVRLKDENIIQDYSDVAILTYSVSELNSYHLQNKPKEIQGLVERLEVEGNKKDPEFHVYAPRAGMLPDCREIKELLGCAANRIGYTDIDDAYLKAAEYCYQLGVPKIIHNKAKYNVVPADYSDVCCQLLHKEPFCNITANSTEYKKLHQVAKYFYQWDCDEHNKMRHINNEPIFTLLTKDTALIQDSICQKLIGRMILIIDYYQYLLDNNLNHSKGKKLMKKCLEEAGKEKLNQDGRDRWAFRYGDKAQLQGLQRYWKNLSEIFYELLEYEPFRTYVSVSAAKTDTADNTETVNILRARNIATLLTYVSEKEASGMNRESILKELLSNTEINEYEEWESDRIPGHVTVTTIHQSKGLEYPVVFVDVTDLNEYIKKQKDKKKQKDEEEQEEKKRIYYTAFSRAENLLVLLNLGMKKKDEALVFLPKSERGRINPLGWSKTLDGISKAERKDSAEMIRTYSFTADYSVYERCPRMYKYTKLLGFPNAVSRGVAKGQIAHSVVEQINRVHREGNKKIIDRINDEWISDRISVAEELNKPLKADERDTLIDNLLKYHVSSRQEKQIRFIEKTLNTIQTVKISDLGEMRYIIGGQVDLVKEDDKKFTVYDFKTGGADDNTIGHYIRQLLLYAYLVKERLGSEVGKVVLYYLDSEEKIKCVLKNGEITEIDRNGKTSDVLSQYIKLSVDDVVRDFDDSIREIIGCRYNKNDLEPDKEKGTEPCIKYRCPMFSYCKRELLRDKQDKKAK